MKLIIALAIASYSLLAFAEKYTCTSATGFTFQGRLWVDSRIGLFYQKRTNDLDRVWIDGKISLDSPYNAGPRTRSSDYCYQASFSKVQGIQNPNYRPTRYKDHLKFSPIDASNTNNCDGGGMYGDFIIPEDRSGEKFVAYYVFQAGDHIGGTLKFNCF